MRRLRRLGMALLMTAPFVAAVIFAPAPANADVTFGTAQNVSLGNQKFGGRMVAVAVDPRNSAHVMAASESGGLWERSGRLFGWTSVTGQGSLARFQLNDVAINASGTVFVTTQDDGVSGQTGSGLWMRRAGSNTWGEVGMPLTPCAMRMSAGHIEIRGTRVYVAQTCGVLISSDGGQTWTLHRPNTVAPVNWTNVSVSSDGVNVATCGTDSSGFGVWIGNTSGWQKATLPLVTSPINDVTTPPPPAEAVSHNLSLIGQCSLAWSPTDPGDLVLTAIDSNAWAHLLETDDFGLTGWVDISPFTTQNRPPFVAMTKSLSPGKPYLYWGDGFGVYRQRCASVRGPDCNPSPETGSQCLDGGITVGQNLQIAYLPGRDDDGDGVINEGCPTRGSVETVGSGWCKDAADNDFDLRPNDGCVAMQRWDVGGHPDITDIGFVRTVSLFNGSVQDCPAYLAGDGGIKSSTTCGTGYIDDNRGLNAFQDYEIAGTALTQSASGVHLDVVTQDNGAYVSANGGTSWTNPIDDADVAEVVNDNAGASYRTVWTECVACNTYIRSGDIADSGKSPFPLPTGTTAPKWNDVIASWGPNKWATFGPGTAVGTIRLYVSTSTSVAWTGVGTNIFAPFAPRSLRVSISQGVPTFYFTLEAPNVTAPLWKIVGTSPTAQVTSAFGAVNAPTGSRLMQPVVSCAGGIGGFRCPAVYAVDPSNPQRLIAADAFDSTIKVSSDGGATWAIDQRATAQVTDFGQYRFEPTAMAIDNGGATLVIGNARTGVVASNSGGASWVRIVGTLNNAPFVTSFYFDSVGQRIWFTSFGRGVWRIPATQRVLG